MKHGSVYQRHSKSCPRTVTGEVLPHRCKGAWAYQIDSGRTIDGRRKQISKGGFRTRAAAMTALRDVTDLLLADVSSAQLTVGEYLDAWITGKHALKPSTRSHYADAIRLYLQPHVGHLQLLELRAHHLDRLYATISTGVRGRPLSTASIRRVHACLRSALSTAVKRRLIPYNPALHVELPPERPQRPETWTVEHCRSFLAAAKEDRLIALYHLMIITGLRRGEAIGLRWSDVDLDAKTIRVVQQITAVRGAPTVGSPKTRSGGRVIPLDTRTATVLRSHQQRQRDERAEWETVRGADDLVFTRENGQTLRPEYVTRHFQVLARSAELPVIRLHDLRHTNATLALEAGIAIKVVSDRLGHANTAITNDLYTHVARGVGMDAAERIAALLGPDPTGPESARGERDAAGTDAVFSGAGADASALPARRVS